MRRYVLELLFSFTLGVIAGAYVWWVTKDPNLAKAVFAIVWILGYWLKE